MKFFWNTVSRLIYFGILGFIVFFIIHDNFPNLLVNGSDILGYVIFVLIIYILTELLIGLVYKPWELIAGTILLMVTLGTFILGLWDKPYDENLYNSSKIDPKIILLVSVAALGFTLWEYVNLLEEKVLFNKIIKFCILLIFATYFIIVGLLNTPSMKEYIGSTNTDYLAFVALSLTFITLGTKKVQK
ncbi:hypothetical protein [Bacillus cereus]|uniref:hypothetical protein n=2 Tax=Bacillus TaxID=1386 RepID=UPI003B674DA2